MPVAEKAQNVIWTVKKVATKVSVKVCSTQKSDKEF